MFKSGGVGAWSVKFFDPSMYRTSGIDEGGEGITFIDCRQTRELSIAASMAPTSGSVSLSRASIWPQMADRNR